MSISSTKQESTSRAVMRNAQLVNDVIRSHIKRQDVHKSQLHMPVLATDQSDIIVCARTRPLLSREIEDKQFECVKALNPQTWLYKPRGVQWNMPRIEIYDFKFDHSFGPEDTNETVYESIMKPLIPIVFSGGSVQLLAYGQTGSGKTYTMSSLEEQVATDLFSFIPKDATPEEPRPRLHLSFFELYGPTAYDLLNDRTPVQIMQSTVGIHVRGLTEREVKNAEEMVELIRLGASFRRTEKTSKNDQGSRSHAICQIRVAKGKIEEQTENVEEQLEGTEKDGKFMIVDLAGSERLADREDHSRDRMKETTEINKSLMNLKECMRKLSLAAQNPTATAPYIPYRNSKLTFFLKNAFAPALMHATGADQDPAKAISKTIVIACVAPSILDASHSLNTLRYAAGIMHTDADAGHKTKIPMQNDVDKEIVAENLKALDGLAAKQYSEKVFIEGFTMDQFELPI